MALLSVQEAAGELGISRVGVERLIRRGELPVIRLGRRVLIEPAALEAVIEQRRTRGRVRLASRGEEAVLKRRTAEVSA